MYLAAWVCSDVAERFDGMQGEKESEAGRRGNAEGRSRRSSLEKFLSTVKVVEQDHEVPDARILLRQMSKTCQESGPEHE